VSPKKTVKYTRPKICRAFGITDRTLRYLERYGLIEFTWESKHGLLSTELSEQQELTLNCARIDVHSIAARHESFRVFPFERFLLLRFFQVEAEELYDELVDRNLIHPKYISVANIEEHYGLFFEALPEELKACALAKREPNKSEREAFEILLTVIGVLQVYQQPHVEQSFEMLSEDNIKMVIEAATATTSSISDICDFLSDATGVEFNASAAVFYQWLFSDFSRMRGEDLKTYMKTISPTHRGLIQQALNRTVGDLRAALGMIGDISHNDAYEMAKRESMGRLLQSMDDKSFEGDKRFHAAMRSFLPFIDREDRKSLTGGMTSKLPEIFNSFQIIPAQMGTEIFNLPQAKTDDESESAAQ
jgi:hypothetical protein